MKGSSALSLLPREEAPPTDQGRTLNKHEVRADVCEGKASSKWIVEHMAPDIGMKHGREYLFYESEARQWWATYLNRRRAVVAR